MTRSASARAAYTAMQRAYFTQMLTWVSRTTFVFAMCALLAWPLGGSRETGAAGTVVAAYGLCALGARRLVDNRRWRNAIAVMCVGLLIALLLVMLLKPMWWPVLALVPVYGVAFALPYITNTAFRWFVMTCWVASTLVIIGSSAWHEQIIGASWLDRMLLAGGMSAIIALVLLLLWQFSSRLHDALDRSQAAEERFMVAVRGANDGIWDWNLQTNTIYYSPRWKEMLSLGDDDVGSTTNEWFDRVHPDDHALLYAAVRAHLRGDTEHLEHEYRARCNDGSYCWMLCRGLAVRDADGIAVRLAGSQTDITTRKRAEDQLRHDSLHDALTGLPNRTLFMNRLAHLLGRGKRHTQPPFAVLFLDLDRFKIVNDSLGHLIGDTLLTLIGQRLADSMRGGDTVARLGGDEFAVLLTELPHPSLALEIAERIQHVIGEPFERDLQDVFTTASIGIAISTSGYASADDMVRDADIAMYRAKQNGKARAVVFDQAMHEHVLQRMQTEHELRRALESGEFIVAYQPLVSLSTGQICGFEALLRWQHGQRGVVPPTEFIAIAEETGLIVPIGRWLLEQACAHIVQWQQRFPSCAPLGISVNLCGAQVRHPQLVAHVAHVLHETGLNPAQLALEITEGVVLHHDDDMVATTLCALHDLGVQLHLDDFGTGYASLINLHNLPISAVKIDRTFVNTMDVVLQNSVIVRAIVALSQNLGLDVIAEGVESAVHVAALRAIGCPYAQGYYFSTPLPPAAIDAMLAAPQHWQRDDHRVPAVALPPIPQQKAFPNSVA